MAKMPGMVKVPKAPKIKTPKMAKAPKVKTPKMVKMPKVKTPKAPSVLPKTTRRGGALGATSAY